MRKTCPKCKIDLKQDVTKDYTCINKDYSLTCPKCNYEIIIIKKKD